MWGIFGIGKNGNEHKQWCEELDVDGDEDENWCGVVLHKWIEFIFYLRSKIADIRKFKEYFFLCFLFLYLLITHFFVVKEKP